MDCEYILGLMKRVPEDIKGLVWRSNCAGEIFIEQDGEPIRIGHFQGDSRTAELITDLYNYLLKEHTHD